MRQWLCVHMAAEYDSVHGQFRFGTESHEIAFSELNSSNLVKYVKIHESVLRTLQVSGVLFHDYSIFCRYSF